VLIRNENTAHCGQCSYKFSLFVRQFADLILMPAVKPALYQRLSTFPPPTFSYPLSLFQQAEIIIAKGQETYPTRF
jgi:hypothetical protein